jgi:phosphinothricin acetyltransferase
VGAGGGSRLLGRLLASLRGADIHALVSAITLPNGPSVGLHEKFGFKQVAVFREIGYKLGAWQQVGYWELLLPLQGLS